MKAICRRDGGFKGLIPDMETYQKLQAGLADWKPHLKSKIKSVEIPYELFEHFMALDKDILEKNGEWYAEWVAEEITNRIKCSFIGFVFPKNAPCMIKKAECLRRADNGNS